MSRASRVSVCALLALMTALLVPSGYAVAQETGPGEEQVEGVDASVVSVTGMYAGSAVGSGKTGDEEGEGRTPITVWVVADDSTAEFTFRADKLGLTVDFEGPLSAHGANDYTVPLNVDSPVMKGTGVVSFNFGPSGWVMGGSGKGSAMGWEGSGRGGAVRIKTEVVKPGIGEQLGDALDNLFGGGAPAAEPLGPPIEFSIMGESGADAVTEAAQSAADVAAAVPESGVETETDEVDPDELEQTVPMSITEQLSALGGVMVVLVIGLFL